LVKSKYKYGSSCMDRCTSIRRGRWREGEERCSRDALEICSRCSWAKVDQKIRYFLSAKFHTTSFITSWQIRNSI